MAIKDISFAVEGFDTVRDRMSTAKLHISGKFVCLDSNCVELFRIRIRDWGAAYMCVLSSISEVWIESLNEISDRTRRVPKNFFKNTPDLQTFVSLIHIASELGFEDQHLEDLENQVLVDHQPPKNRIYILSHDLQMRLREDTALRSSVIKLGGIYKMNQREKYLFYRPYNTPVMRFPVESLSVSKFLSECSKNYRLLGNS